MTKPSRRQIDVPVRYIGFEIPDRFVVGYGLDLAERTATCRTSPCSARAATTDLALSPGSCGIHARWYPLPIEGP
jgi:hypoxanthine phosphoribosyltransferase